MFEFKEKSFNERVKEYKKAIKRYHDRVPCIVEVSEANKKDFTLDKHKYLVPSNMTLSTFIYILRRRISVFKDQALYVFIVNEDNTVLPQISKTMGEIQNQYKSDCGFVYCLVSLESTFGH